MKYLALILIFLMIFITPLTLNSKNAVSQPQMWFENLSEIQHLEYYLEFSPEQKGYSTTKYAMDFETIETEGDSILKIDVKYEDMDLTEAGENFNYEIILDTHEIHEVSIEFYREFIKGTHTELFLDLTNIGTSQTFRVDETVIFADYLKIEVYKEVTKLDLSFSYIGEKQYNKDLKYNFNTYHYQAYYQWDSPGIYWDSVITWTIIADYYFDNITGILIAENLYIHRYDFKPNKPVAYSTKDLYINRTLALVNSMIIMDSYERIGGIADPGLEDLYIWIVSLAVIIPSAAITIVLLRKHYFKRK